jgi:hypothetical protein
MFRMRTTADAAAVLLRYLRRLGVAPAAHKRRGLPLLVRERDRCPILRMALAVLN